LRTGVRGTKFEPCSTQREPSVAVNNGPDTSGADGIERFGERPVGEGGNEAIEEFRVRLTLGVRGGADESEDWTDFTFKLLKFTFVFRFFPALSAKTTVTT
jgi:hypothetical protein